MTDDPAPQSLTRALSGLDPETRRAMARALERGAYELEGGDWGERGDGAGCLLSLAAWEMGLDDGEALMSRSVDAVRVPALFDAWWSSVLAREGDVVHARRTVREAVSSILYRSLVDEPCEVSAPSNSTSEATSSAPSATGSPSSSRVRANSRWSRQPPAIHR